MSPLLTSHGLVFAMAISAGSLILFDLFKEKKRLFSTDPLPPLKSCLSSSGSGCGDGGKKKNKKVKFAEDVRESRSDGEIYRRRNHEHYSNCCGGQEDEEEEEAELMMKKEMPANHMALYSGILRDRRRIQFSY